MLEFCCVGYDDNKNTDVFSPKYTSPVVEKWKRNNNSSGNNSSIFFYLHTSYSLLNYYCARRMNDNQICETEDGGASFSILPTQIKREKR